MMEVFMKKVSVIVPVYNVEDLLSKCLDSLVNQTFDDYEVIVVNDGSPDNSQNIIDDYYNRYPNVIKPLKKENGGLSSARNYGLKYAEGEYVLYVDSDDWVSSDILEKMYSLAINDSSDIVVCRSYMVRNDNLEEMDQEILSLDLYKRYILNRPSAHCKLVKKEILLHSELAFLEGHHYEDIAEVPAFCLYAKNISFVDDYLYYYLVREGSIMHNKEYSEKLNDIFDSIDNLTNIFINKNAFDKYKDELEFLYIKHLLHAASLRFLPYEEGLPSINIVCEIMEDKFPSWCKNKYYKKMNLKYKIVCNLIYKKKFRILKKILKIN